MALSDGLQLAFDMNETGGGSAIDSVQGIEAIAQGTNTTIPHRIDYLGSRLLSGASQQRFGAVHSAAFGFLSQGSWTGECWVTFSNLDTAKDIVSKFLTTNDNRGFILTYSSAAGKINLIVSADGASNSGSVQGNPTIVLGQRYHILFGHDTVNDELWIRINGGARAVTSYSGGQFNALGAFTIGGRAGSTSLTLDGLVSKVRMWNRTLLVEEQNKIYNKGCPVPYSALSSFTGMYRIAVYGQSNASGRGANNRQWSHANQFLAQYHTNTAGSTTWAYCSDPFDANSKVLDSVATEVGDGGGHWIHSYATKRMQETGEAVGCLVVAKGGMGITGFLPGVDRFDRSTMYGSLLTHATFCGGVEEVLWWQGESDMVNGRSQSAYYSDLTTLANALKADMPAGYRGLRVCKIQQLGEPTVPQANQDAINAAIEQAWNENPNVLIGPDFSGMTTDDGRHFTTNAKIDLAGQMWRDSEIEDIPDPPDPPVADRKRRFLLGIG